MASAVAFPVTGRLTAARPLSVIAHCSPTRTPAGSEIFAALKLMISACVSSGVPAMTAVPAGLEPAIRTSTVNGVAVRVIVSLAPVTVASAPIAVFRRPASVAAVSPARAVTENGVPSTRTLQISPATTVPPSVTSEVRKRTAWLAVVSADCERVIVAAPVARCERLVRLKP